MKIKKYKFLSIILALIVTGCKVEDPYNTGETAAQESETEKREQYFLKTFAATITLQDEFGNLVKNAAVDLDGKTITSNDHGIIELPAITVGTHRLNINIDDYLPHVETLYITQSDIKINTRLLTKNSTQAGLLFAGDTMFGRRYLDPELKTMTANIPDLEEALIRPATASENAQALTQFVAPLFNAVDFASVNLETPITATPKTVHPTKEFSFFSLPETLDGIKAIGVDYVALGNNHIYDFLEDGLDDTLLEVSNAGFAHSGAGKNNQQAFLPIYMDIGALTLGLFSATSITGEEHEITYVASEIKGGAADLTNEELTFAALTKTINNSDYSIVQMHGGDEYSYTPTPFLQSRYESLSSAEVDLFVAHHPHVAQGFAVYNGVPTLLGLGNFMFDQDRLETLLGIATMIRINKDNKNPTERAVVYPIYVEGYQPKFAHGALSDYLFRRIAEFSDDNITLIPRNGYADVFFNKDQATVSRYTQTITVDSDQQIIDLRNYAPSSKAFLSELEIINGTSNDITLGRDLMIFGDFEDWDNDDEQFEVARWDHTGDSVTPCLSGARSGVQGLCSARTQYDNTPSLLPFRQTIRAMELPNDDGSMNVYKEFSFFGYSKAENAGKLDAKIVYTTEEDGLEFSTQLVDIQPAGSHDWQPFNHDFSLPSDELTLGPDNLPPRGIKVTLRHFSPNSGEANLAVDDIAMISWQQKIALSNAIWRTDKIHGFDFLRLNSMSPVTLKLTYSTFN